MNRCATPGVGLDGGKTRNTVVPGPLYDEPASYDMTPNWLVCWLERVSPDAVPTNADRTNNPKSSADRFLFIYSC